MTHLGIVIEPAEVPLISSIDNAYVWKVLQHMFKKHISSHSAGAYRDSCGGAEKLFEAVLSDNTYAATRSDGVKKLILNKRRVP